MNIELNDYERDNLLALICAVAREPGAQSAMNNGDWVMQIAYKLGWQFEHTDWGNPNYNSQQMAEQVAKRGSGTQKRLI